MKTRITTVDAFATKPFTGNPAAVCILAEPVDEPWMRNVASEMNLSETAFLIREGDGFNLRWFTPAAEVDLCGHATLASAHVLWEDGHLDRNAEARFTTRSGALQARNTERGIELNFPALFAEPTEAPEGLLDALGLDSAVAIARSRFDYLVEVDNERTVRNLAPDFGRLQRVDARGVMVTSRSHDESYDFVSRFFAPRVGVDEDPVTGSAHCALAPWWCSRLGRNELTGYQASTRGGRVGVRMEGDRVVLIGAAITVMVGELRG
ncbi:MAG: PhzF family phenazine biosynthesis protein [Longimicrobiales bacterium]